MRSILACALLGMLSWPVTAQAVPIATYLMDEADGNQSLLDNSGGNSTGFLGSSNANTSGDPTRQNDSPFNNGRALSLAASPAQFATLVDTGGGFNYSGANKPFTAEIWIKPTSLVTALLPVQRFLSYGDTWVLRSELNGGSAKLRGYFNGTAAGDIFGVSQLRANAWQHVALRYTGSSPGTNRLEIYVNGELNGVDTSGVSSPNAAGTTVALSSSSSENYRGAADEARVSSDATGTLGAFGTFSSTPAVPLSPQYTTGSYTLTANGGFETGVTSGGIVDSLNADQWSGDGNGNLFFRSIEDPARGGHAMAITERTNQQVVTTIPVTGLIVNQQYVLSGYIYRNGLGNARLDLNDVAEDSVPGFENALKADVVGGYDFVYATFTALAASRTVRVVVDGTTDIAASQYFFDDIAVTPLGSFVAPVIVPEPSSLTLLGVAGSILFWRRLRRSSASLTTGCTR